MNVFKEPRPQIFEYGFLTSKTAQILYEYSPTVPIDSESRRILKFAELFIEKILSGEAFVSGEKERLAHDGELHALHYGIGALYSLHEDKIIRSLNDRTDLLEVLSNIKQTLRSIQIGSGVIPPQDSEEAAKFFDAIAGALLNEAREHWYSEAAY